MKLSNTSAAVAALAVAAAVPGAANAANLLTNGNFEAAGSGGSNAPGWTIQATDPNSVLVLKGSDYIPCCGATGSQAALDNKFVSFGAGESPNWSVGAPAGIYQEFNATAGSKQLTFDFGSIGGSNQSLGYVIYNGTDAISYGNFDSNVTNNLDTLFKTYTVNFTSAAGPLKIGFLSLDGTGSKDAFLDNVSISAVPEPATWAMMIMGIGFAGAAMRRRQSVRVAYA